jgi:3-dehydroquinate synthase
MVAQQLAVIGAEAKAYSMHIGTGLLESVLPEFISQHGFRQAALVTNTTLAPLYGERLAEKLPGAFLITTPDGEQFKTLKTVRAIYDQLLSHGADRSMVMVALGGGVVGDVVGYAAATYMRGIPLVQCPTTLLAMVDSCIGGKVGVDLQQGKNLVGAFKDPLAIFADSGTLDTLPPVEFACGMAETIKAGFIADPGLLEHLEQFGAQPIEEIIARAANVKIEIVQQDRLEQNIRAYLNLGHTFAHALEKVSGYALRHGEAVSIGVVAAARLSETLSLAQTGLSDRAEKLFKTFNLPVRFGDYPLEAILDAMQHDKKKQNNSLRFVLLEGIGKPTIHNQVPPESVLDVLKSLRQ